MSHRTTTARFRTFQVRVLLAAAALVLCCSARDTLAAHRNAFPPDRPRGRPVPTLLLPQAKSDANRSARVDAVDTVPPLTGYMEQWALANGTINSRAHFYAERQR